MHDARRAVPFGGTAAGAGRRWLYAGSGERANLYPWRWYWQAKMVEHEPGAQRPVSVPGPSFRHGRFDRRKPLARPAEIYRKKRKKVQLRTVSVDFAVCQKFGAANFHGLDRPTVIRKATSQTTLSALEPAPSPASKSRRRRVGDSHRLATDAHVAPSSRTRLGNGTGRRERLVPYCGPARLLGPLRLGPTSHLKSSIHFYFCSLQFSQPQPS